LIRLAVFVSPHGFGHAARAAAVLAALHERVPDLEVALYTTVPRWFFDESLGFPFTWRELACDVGLVQKSALEEDLPASAERLGRFWREVRDGTLAELVAELREENFDAALCDISPLGLLAASVAGLPSVLVENFTWDWIYEPLVGAEPRFARWVRHLRPIFESATLRIQAEPACAPAYGEIVSVPPIARRPRASRHEVRERLGIASDRAMVLVSFGGVEGMLFDPQAWSIPDEVEIVVPGGAAEERRIGRLVLLPHHTPLFHPDLVAASDVVVGKLGYSTVAEAVAAGTAMLYVPRPGFRESPVLERYVAERLPSAPIGLGELRSGAWLGRLPALAAARRTETPRGDGAAHAAAAVLAHLGGELRRVPGG